MKKSKFIIYKDLSGNFRFRIIAGNGRIFNHHYNSKQSVMRAFYKLQTAFNSGNIEIVDQSNITFIKREREEAK